MRNVYIFRKLRFATGRYEEAPDGFMSPVYEDWEGWLLEARVPDNDDTVLDQIKHRYSQVKIRKLAVNIPGHPDDYKAKVPMSDYDIEDLRRKSGANMPNPLAGDFDLYFDHGNDVDYKNL